MPRQALLTNANDQKDSNADANANCGRPGGAASAIRWLHEDFRRPAGSGGRGRCIVAGQVGQGWGN